MRINKSAEVYLADSAFLHASKETCPIRLKREKQLRKRKATEYFL